jgi:hypothetical protein
LQSLSPWGARRQLGRNATWESSFSGGNRLARHLLSVVLMETIDLERLSLAELEQLLDQMTKKSLRTHVQQWLKPSPKKESP